MRRDLKAIHHPLVGQWYLSLTVQEVMLVFNFKSKVMCHNIFLLYPYKKVKYYNVYVRDEIFTTTSPRGMYLLKCSINLIKCKGTTAYIYYTFMYTYIHICTNLDSDSYLSESSALCFPVTLFSPDTGLHKHENSHSFVFSCFQTTIYCI